MLDENNLVKFGSPNPLLLAWGGVSCEHMSQMDSTSASVLRACSSCDAWTAGPSTCWASVSCSPLSRNHCSRWLRLYLHTRSVTCHVGSHSITSHPTQVNAPHPSPAARCHATTALGDSGCTCTQSHGASPAIRDHTVSPATPHRWTRPRHLESVVTQPLL